MNITPEMLQASTKKAVELGILPRKNYIEDLATNTEIMLEILRATLDSIPEDRASAGHGRDPR